MFNGPLFTHPSFRAPSSKPTTHFKYTDLLYSTLVADGTIVPPVIITNDANVPKDVEGKLKAKVLYMPNIKKPSARTTLAYLDAVKEYFNVGDHIIMDRGKEFENKKVWEQLADMHIIHHKLPTAGGVYTEIRLVGKTTDRDGCRSLL